MQRLLWILSFGLLLSGFSCPNRHMTSRSTVKTSTQESNVILLGPKLSQDQIHQAIEEWFRSKKQDPSAAYPYSEMDNYAHTARDPFFVEGPEDVDTAFSETEEGALDVRCFNYVEEIMVLGIIPETIYNQFCVQKIQSRDVFMLTFLRPQGRAESAELAFKDLRKYLISVFGYESVHYGELTRVTRPIVKK